jgi:FdhD protein
VDIERIRDVPIHRFEKGVITATVDDVAAEEPFEIRVGGRSIAVIMRTPGHDLPLATGFLLTEGVIRDVSDIGLVQPALDRDGYPQPNVLDFRLAADRESRAHDRARAFTITSSCGLCGAASIEEACSRATPVRGRIVTQPTVLLSLSATMRAAQEVFARTGGLHAAGLFDADGTLILLREDVGRHNALDKVIGEMSIQGKLPLESNLVLVSGRASFELVQKAAIASIPILVAVSAPSSLAVEAANALGITLVGILRTDRFVVYSHPNRVCQTP